MLQKKVFERYKELFSVSDDKIDSWIANGKNSIRIKNHLNKELVFTYRSQKNWLLETKDAFVDRLCLENRMRRSNKNGQIN